MKLENADIDEPLLLLVSQGNELAFAQLFRKYSRLLYSFLYEHLDSASLADDLVQDIFTKIWVSREAMRDIRQFRSLLYVLARNHALNNLKKRIRERNQQTQWAAVQPLDEKENERQGWERQLDIVDEAVKGLPEQQQKVWIKSRREKMKYQQIAADMNLSKETVKKYLQYANSTIIKYVASRIDIGVILLLYKII